MATTYTHGSLRYFYQVNNYGDPIPGSNVAIKRKPVHFGKGQRWVEYVPVAQLPSCCQSNGITTEGSITVTTIHRRTRYYVRLREGTNFPISGTLEKHANKPGNKNYPWMEVVSRAQCATSPLINITTTWTGVDPHIVHIPPIFAMKDAVDDGRITFEVLTAEATNEGDMTVDLDASGNLTVTQVSPGADNTNTITIQYSNGDCLFAVQVTFVYTA